MQTADRNCVMVIDFSNVAQSCNVYDEFISTMACTASITYRLEENDRVPTIVFNGPEESV